MLLYALGLPVPGDLEGQVQRDVFESTFVRANPVVICEPTQPPEEFPSAPMDLEGQEAVASRLRALGYLD
jgi:hypothetical protein